MARFRVICRVPGCGYKETWPTYDQANQDVAYHRRISRHGDITLSGVDET